MKYDVAHTRYVRGDNDQLNKFVQGTLRLPAAQQIDALLNTNVLRSVSLFSGAGGLDIGFERAGFTTVWANEFDYDAASTWMINRPYAKDVMIIGDIDEHIEELSNLHGQVDVLFGGPPCQGFSVAGKMDPEDARSNLVWSFLNAVERVHPKVFVMENVAALGRLSRWEYVRNGIKERALELGYNLSWRIWHTPDFGVPQNRDRVIFLGVADGDSSAFEKAMVHHQSIAPTAREVLQSVGAYGTEDNPRTCTSNISLAKRPVLRRSPYAGMLVNGAGRPIDLDGLPPTLAASIGGNKTPIVDQAALDDSSRENWFVGYHNRLVRGEVKPSDVELPETLRRLTLNEAAAIQTFPRGYEFIGAKSKRYRQIGNAVPSLFAEAVARSIREAYFTGQ